jgi:hypothetical protein
MVSSSFFAASGWRAGLATLEIAVSRQIDVRPPVYTPAFVHGRIPWRIGGARSRSPSRKFVGDFPRLRFLNGPRFNAMVLSQELVTRQFANLASHYTGPIGLPLTRALWSALDDERR